MNVTGSLIKTLSAFMDHPTQELYGLQVASLTGLKSGTLYPLLDRLEREGWLISRWEQVDPQQMGRPPRRFYGLTPSGFLDAKELLADHGVRSKVADTCSQAKP